jgi:ankyrin repeat protein
MNNLPDLRRLLPEPEMWEYNGHLAFFNTCDNYDLDFLKTLLLKKISRSSNALKYTQIYSDIPDKPLFCLSLAVQASAAGDIKDSVRLLINVIKSLRINTTPLHIACEYGLLNVATSLVSETRDINAQDYLGWTPMHWAAWLNEDQILQLLIKNGASIEARGNHNETPFYLAAFNGHLEASKILLDNNASMSVCNSLSHAPLHLVSYNEHLHIMSLMLSYGANIDIRSGIRYNTPLHVAAWHGKLESAIYLLDNGCDINARMINGCTPLHRAALNGKTGLIVLLLNRGANIDAVDLLGRTPIACARKNKHLEAYKVLLLRGADINK